MENNYHFKGKGVLYNLHMKISNKALLLLLENSQDWYDAASIADIFGVSAKTVSNYVKRINDYKENLILSSNKGYMLNHEINIENERNSLFFNDDSKSRVNYILKNLLREDGRISTYFLADTMFISDSHLETLLKQVKRNISKFDLVLGRKRNVIFLEGSEINKRKLLSSLLQKENNNFFEISNNFYFSNIPNIKDYIEQLSTILNKYEVYVNDYNYITLISYLCILVERISDNNVLDSDIAPTYKIYSEQDMFKEIKIITENFFNIKINDYEMHYLTLIICNNCTSINPKEITLDNIAKFVPQEIIDQTLLALVKLENYYHLSQFGEDFKVKIILHTLLMIDRIKSTNTQSNSMLTTIKTKYPFIYEMSIYFVKEMFKEDYIKVPDSEITFLAIHIGAYINDNYISNDKLNCVFVHMNYHDYFIKQINEITKKFEDSIQIVASFNAKFIEQMPKNVDFIITNYPFLKNDDFPIVYVDEILSPKNINEIHHFIETLKNQKQKQIFKDSLKTFLSEKLFYRNIQMRNVEGYEDIINMITDDAEKLGLCHSEFKKEVFDRERLSSTAYDSSIAIPHSLYSNCKSSFLAIAINDEPVYWDDHKVNIILLIGVKSGDEDFFKIIVDNIIPFFSENSNILKCLSINSYDEFIEKLTVEIFD